MQQTTGRRSEVIQACAESDEQSPGKFGFDTLLIRLPSERSNPTFQMKVTPIASRLI